MDMIDWLGGIVVVFATALLTLLLVMLVNILIISMPEAKQCIKSGGEPYYFVTTFECRNNLNINIEGE